MAKQKHVKQIAHFVSRDELVALAQAGHHAATLEPRNRREAAAEEDALDGSERDESLAKRYALVKRCALVGYPSRRPVGFLLDAFEIFDRLKYFVPTDIWFAWLENSTQKLTYRLDRR